ncbi:hypothetical protein GCM10010156_61140 [Planobispora rosea]|uniref:Uncharacterized protein n=1 Tax=Planobispora rosea TaxID=35762 RepID=A0A8J3S7A5_PLARO|nr:hypothetical protein [Planobispora rosea]GGS94681.1 hypothetical protein GCM10010156_61140 [Planobispora rosea]GIH87415.1 hypothetical protein Pro02_58230 [Planobispora rosea]
MFLTVVIACSLSVIVLAALAVAVLAMKREDKRMRLHRTPRTTLERYSRRVMGLYVRDEECAFCPDLPASASASAKGGDQR